MTKLKGKPCILSLDANNAIAYLCFQLHILILQYMYITVEATHPLEGKKMSIPGAGHLQA